MALDQPEGVGNLRGRIGVWKCSCGRDMLVRVDKDFDHVEMMRANFRPVAEAREGQQTHRRSERLEMPVIFQEWNVRRVKIPTAEQR